jgi:hypothetical protein
MNPDRQWNDRLRPDEVETVPFGRPARDLVLLALVTGFLAYVLALGAPPDSRTQSPQFAHSSYSLAE